MGDRIVVDPDITACMREDRRIQLSHLVNNGHRVRVTNPLRNASWEGVIFGLADHPTMLVRLDDGRERAFPQSFAVEEIDPLPEIGGTKETVPVDLTTAAQELTAAAEKLQAMAEAALADLLASDYYGHDPANFSKGIDNAVGGEAGELAAVFSPELAGELVRALKAHADEHSAYDCDWVHCPMVALARVINREVGADG